LWSEPVGDDRAELREQRLEVNGVVFDPQRLRERLGVAGVRRADLVTRQYQSVHAVGPEGLNGERGRHRRVEAAAHVHHRPVGTRGVDPLRDERADSVALGHRDPVRQQRPEGRPGAVGLAAVVRRDVSGRPPRRRGPVGTERALAVTHRFPPFGPLVRPVERPVRRAERPTLRTVPESPHRSDPEIRFVRRLRSVRRSESSSVVRGFRSAR